ncbi:very low-density lipoprotein receptor-like [Sycon ciliatum]|uniref:very low-density lipoprotein receptor-like n=1 Tax=Sycon ciliatum TaxID=27933 RepID=UPI0031F71B2C
MFLASYVCCIAFLLGTIWSSCTGQIQNGSCVATYLRQAGISRTSAATYESNFAQRSIPPHDINSTQTSFLPLFGVSDVADVVKLAACFAGQAPSCASFQYCSGEGQCVLLTSGGNPQTYECRCHAGYSGRECETDACSNVDGSSTCQNGGVCVRQSTAPYFRCQCSENFEGAQCLQAVDRCGPQNPCAHGGRCTSLRNGFKCDCPRGYVGKTCQEHLLTSKELDLRLAKLDSRLALQDRTFLSHIESLKTQLLANVRQRTFAPGLRLFRGGYTWYEARYRCRVLGGILAVPRSNHEMQIVIQLRRRKRCWGRIWIGVTDVETEGRWKDVEGRAIRYTRWYPGEPRNDSGAEDCVTIINANGQWDDIPCTRSNSGGFLCRFM